MKILITGGAGYLGSVLTHSILDSAIRHQVTVLDNFRHKVPSLSFMTRDPFLNIVKGDVRDHGLMKKLIATHDIVVHLAAIVGAPACKQNEQMAASINVAATMELSKLISREQLFLFPMTNSGYGTGGEEWCTEESPLKPVSAYGIHKVMAETYVLDAGGISFRFATLFGPSFRMRLDLMVNDFVYQASQKRGILLYEPHFRRNFLHVEDAACLFHSTITEWIDNCFPFKGQVFNAGNDECNCTKEELCRLVQQHAERFSWVVADGKDPDQRNYMVSNKKILSEGFWKPKKNLEQGIQELMRTYIMDCFENSGYMWRNA